MCEFKLQTCEYPTGLGGVGRPHFINSYNLAHFFPRPLQFFPSPYALISISSSSVCDGFVIEGLLIACGRIPAEGFFMTQHEINFLPKLNYICVAWREVTLYVVLLLRI